MNRILVEKERNGLKMAYMEKDQLVEYMSIPFEVKYGAGHIFKGRVVDVLPGMQAAFVDIGQARNAFLYVDDILPANMDKHPLSKPTIRDLVSEGEEIIVQVSKEAMGTKGAKVTTHYALASRRLVYMPEADYVAVSRKIEHNDERERLKDVAEQMLLPGEGVIVRTLAEGEQIEWLEQDLQQLREIWKMICEQAKEATAPALLYAEQASWKVLVRDLLTHQVDECIVGNAKLAEEIRAFVSTVSPELTSRIIVHHSSAVMDDYGVLRELDKAYRPKFWLKSGGYLVIDQTEALTVIDVNTGKFTGSIDLEQTVFATNMEAAEEISRLLRLRDMGGIIIVDYIDMNEEGHQQEVLRKMEETLVRDRTKSTIVGWTKLGLLEMTRRKIRIGNDLDGYHNCPTCGGTGKLFMDR